MVEKPMLCVRDFAVDLPSRPGVGAWSMPWPACASMSRWARALVSLGESGAGKSVLLRTLAGLYRPSAGAFRFAGTEIGSLRARPSSSAAASASASPSRALVLEPKLLLLDEPVSALDVSIHAQVLNLLADLRHGRGLSYVVVSHDLGTLRFLAERIGVMVGGRLVETAAAADLVRAPTHDDTRRLLAAVPSVAKSLARRALVP